MEYTQSEFDTKIKNCILRKNDTGIYILYCDPCIINCVIQNNVKHGFECQSSNPYIINCFINDNGNDNIAGGGIFNFNSSPRILNCTIAKNNAYYGGGIYNEYYSSPSITNSIFWSNIALECSQIYNYDYSTPAVTFCDVQGGYLGAGNISTDPCFVDLNANNFHLKKESLCIDKGTNTPPGGITLPSIDIDGENRKIDGDANDTFIVDIGADEFFISPADFDMDGVVGFLDYAILANTWLTQAGEPN